MKTAVKVLAILALSATTAWAQGIIRDDFVRTNSGAAVANATVRVCNAPTTQQRPCLPLAAIFSDLGLTQALSNPTPPTGSDGRYTFYATPGRYRLEISSSSVNPNFDNVVLAYDATGPSPWIDVSASSRNMRGDFKQSSMGSITSGSMTLTCTDCAFVSGDATKAITVAGAGTSGALLATTISSVQDSTHAILALAASTTVSGAQVDWGTDNSPLLTTILNSCPTVNPKGCTLFVPPGIYYFASGVSTTRDDVTLKGFNNTGHAQSSPPASSTFVSDRGIVLLKFGVLDAATTHDGPEIDNMSFAEVGAGTQVLGAIELDQMEGFEIHGVNINSLTNSNAVGIKLNGAIGASSVGFTQWGSIYDLILLSGLSC